MLTEFLKANINTFERVPTSEPGEVELLDTPRATTTAIRLPHVVKLQVPTTLDNITVSFEPKCQGPVVRVIFSCNMPLLTFTHQAIEISLITKLPELASIARASPTVQGSIISATKNISTQRAKLEPGDVTLVNSVSRCLLRLLIVLTCFTGILSGCTGTSPDSS